MKYRNETGAGWRRSAVEVIAPGATFEATAREHERFSRRQTPGFVLLSRAGPEVTPEESTSGDVAETPNESAEGVRSTEDAPSRETWTLKISPQRYLELYPEGPQAGRARVFLSQKE